MALFAGRATIVVRHDPTWELELAGFSNRGPSTGVHALPQIRAFVFRDSATQQQLAAHLMDDHDGEILPVDEH